MVSSGYLFVGGQPARPRVWPFRAQPVVPSRGRGDGPQDGIFGPEVSSSGEVPRPAAFRGGQVRPACRWQERNESRGVPVPAPEGLFPFSAGLPAPRAMRRSVGLDPPARSRADRPSRDVSPYEQTVGGVRSLSPGSCSSNGTEGARCPLVILGWRVRPAARPPTVPPKRGNRQWASPEVESPHQAEQTYPPVPGGR